MQQHMRPFNPYTEDIDMYLEEAKEKHLLIPNQSSLKQWAARVNTQNEDIVKRDEKARQDQVLKKNLERDEKIAKARKEREKRKQKKLNYEQYLENFDKKFHKGKYDSNNSIKNVTESSLIPATYTGWKPRIWSTDGNEVQPQFKNNQFQMSNFDIVVDTETKTHFVSNFPKLNSTWADSSQSNDITQVKFDINDPYFSSLANAYKVFCLTGFSLQHLNSTDPFVKSLSNYFVYYWMSILQRKPYSPSKDIIDILKKNHPLHKVWTKEFHQGMETPTWWMKRQPLYKQGKMRNAKPVFAKDRHFGQVGINYEKVTYIGPKSDSDWTQLIPSSSSGLTKLGQKMFQQSLESFVFCILDAQAKTGWSITEQGAKSYQTQDVFRKLVQDTIIQSDVTITISNMKKAILDTGVSLNFALIPNTILIPSDLRLQKKIPGFNNILTLVNPQFMHFGENIHVNPREKQPIHDTSHDKDNTNPTTHSSREIPSTELVSKKQPSSVSMTTTVVGGVLVGVILKLVLDFF